jgi:hypothetical protein
MSAPDVKRNSAVDLKSAAQMLERILAAQIEEHQRLRECIDRKREAIRTADINAVSSICGDENVVIQRVAELERRRLELVGRMTQAINAKATAPMTLSQLAVALGDGPGTRLAAYADQLRSLIAQVQRQSSIVRNAAEALSRHMSGIVQTVHSALSRARVYSHRGQINLGVQLESSLDLKS